MPPESCYNARNNQAQNIWTIFAGGKTMLRSLGPVELLIILAIVLLLFGVGRVSKVGKELGSAISEFRKGLNEGSEPKDKADDDEPEA
jgi:sec-independent protein translocase protein TatA